MDTTVSVLRIIVFILGMISLVSSILAFKFWLERNSLEGHLSSLNLDRKDEKDFHIKEEDRLLQRIDVLTISLKECLSDFYKQKNDLRLEKEDLDIKMQSCGKRIDKIHDILNHEYWRG